MNIFLNALNIFTAGIQVLDKKKKLKKKEENIQNTVFT